MDEKYRVNRNVKRLMEAAGLRPRQVDRLAGFKIGTTERIAAEKRKVYADELLPIAGALGVPVGKLFSQMSSQ